MPILHRMSRDRFAACHLRSLRLDRGMSPEQLGWAVGVSGHTIRRIERDHAVPTPRVQFALAQFFALRPTEIWQVERRRAVA
jgi:DNA-binding XRE family transcriptional regulator